MLSFFRLHGYRSVRPCQRIFSIGKARQHPLGRPAPTFHKSPTPHLPSEGILRAEGPKAVSPVQAKRRTGYIVRVRTCALKGQKHGYSAPRHHNITAYAPSGRKIVCGHNTQGAASLAPG